MKTQLDYKPFISQLSFFFQSSLAFYIIFLIPHQASTKSIFYGIKVKIRTSYLKLPNHIDVQKSKFMVLMPKKTKRVNWNIAMHIRIQEWTI